jgi:hypothetical protein
LPRALILGAAQRAFAIVSSKSKQLDAVHPQLGGEWIVASRGRAFISEKPHPVFRDIV